MKEEPIITGRNQQYWKAPQRKPGQDGRFYKKRILQPRSEEFPNHHFKKLSGIFLKLFFWNVAGSNLVLREQAKPSLIKQSLTRLQ